MPSVPKVFVSSTCYDLRQVRADLTDFISSLGLEPILSDHDSFPVDPTLTAVENCLKIVDDKADLFVLIVGGRYGSTDEQGKSVTNLEYLRARAKGIPIYVFVQKSILNIIPVWKDNPKGNFQSVVDSPKLFSFVASLMDTENVWIFPFDLAQQIMPKMRTQLAYLFLDSLQLRKRFIDSHLPPSLSELEGPELRLVIERPILWEYRLFSEVLHREICKGKKERLDLRYGTALGKGQRIDGFQVFSWLGDRSRELGRMISRMDTLVNIALQDALGPHGIPGDPEALVYVGRKLAEAYKSAIQWTLDFQQVDVDEDFQKLAQTTSIMASNMIKEIEDFSVKLKKELESNLVNLPKPGEQRIVELSLTLTLPDMSECYAEIERINKKYGFD